MTIQYAGTVAEVIVLIPAGLAVTFLLLLFGLVIAPAVFAKPERAERARAVLTDLLPWLPFFTALIRHRRLGEPKQRPESTAAGDE